MISQLNRIYTYIGIVKGEKWGKKGKDEVKVKWAFYFKRMVCVGSRVEVYSKKSINKKPHPYGVLF